MNNPCEYVFVSKSETIIPTNVNKFIVLLLAALGQIKLPVQGFNNSQPFFEMSIYNVVPAPCI